MTENGLVYFLKTGVKFRILFYSWSTDFKERNSGRRRGVENGAIKMKQNHQKVDTRVLNDAMIFS